MQKEPSPAPEAPLGLVLSPFPPKQILGKVVGSWPVPPKEKPPLPLPLPPLELVPEPEPLILMEGRLLGHWKARLLELSLLVNPFHQAPRLAAKLSRMSWSRSICFFYH